MGESASLIASKDNRQTIEFSPWPVFEPGEQEAVLSVMQSGKVNYWTGTEVRSFEKEFAIESGTDYCVALMNGTVAIEAALEALGVGPGDDVLVTPRTFIASASSIARVGARPIFADVDLDSGNVTAETLDSAKTAKTKGALVVHLGGWPCEMDAISSLASQHGWFVIEDCAQAHGGRYKGEPVGSMSTISAWSFCQDKILTTLGEGGAVCTSDQELWEKMWSVKDHGKSFDAVYNRPHPPGFRWLHENLGTNWRMTEVQGAVGRSVLRKLPTWSERRRENAAILSERLQSRAELRVPIPNETCHHAYYRFYAYLRPEQLKDGWNRQRILEAVNDQHVPLFSGSCSEVYLEKSFQSAGLAPCEPLKNAKELGETSLCFLVHPTLESQHMHRVADVLTDVLEEAVL